MSATPTERQLEESTPLLADGGSAVNNTNGTITSPSLPAGEQGNDPTTARRPLSKVERALLILHSISLGSLVMTLAFHAAVYTMNSYASSRFQAHDYRMELDASNFFWACLFVAVFNVVNVALVASKGHYLPAVINIIPLGVAVIVILGITATRIVDRIDSTASIYCDVDLGDTWAPGSYRECRDWVPRYMIVSWIYLVLGLISGLSILATVITCFVKVYKERTQYSRLRGPGANINYQPGLLSVEVAIRWGPPSWEQSSEGRQSDRCRHCQDQAHAQNRTNEASPAQQDE